MRKIVIEHSSGGIKNHRPLDVSEALEWSRKLLGGIDVDEDEHFRALAAGMQALADFAELKSVNYKKSVQMVAAQLRFAYQRGYDARAHEEIEAQFARADARQSKPSFVYFILAATGEIKIGMAVDVVQRLNSLQTSHPAKLEILATTSGGRKRERQYHERFAAHRLHGEWFEPHPDILAEIERLSHPKEQ